MKIKNEKIVKRWDKVMYDISCEHLTIDTEFTELESRKKCYGVEDGISIDWMIKEAEYWLSCYYESGHDRCEMRFDDEDCYKTWVSEIGKLKRLIAKLKTLENETIVEW